MGSVLGIVGVAAMLCPGVAFAECHFKLPVAIVCSSGYSASLAYQKFGFDVQKIGKDYALETLRRAGCSRVQSPKFRTASIKQISHGRVPFADGWEFVTTINLLDRDIWVVDDHYLVGTCTKFVPDLK